MALRPKNSISGVMQNRWRSMLSRLGGNKQSFATSTTPKMKLFVPTMNAVHADRTAASWAAKGEYAPVYVVMGMVMVAVAIGLHTAKQQLVHSPTVQVNKKKRESIPEVEDPDQVVASADKFINKSFLRKVAHIQHDDRVLPDPTRPDPFTRPRRAETLKTAGVDPARR